MHNSKTPRITSDREENIPKTEERKKKRLDFLKGEKYPGEASMSSVAFRGPGTAPWTLLPNMIFRNRIKIKILTLSVGDFFGTTRTWSVATFAGRFVFVSPWILKNGFF